MDSQQLEALLAELSEIVFEPSFDRRHAPHTAGLVFGRMTRSVKELIVQFRATCFRERMQLFLRPLGEDGLGLSFIIRESLFIANNAPLQYNGAAFRQFASGLQPSERIILACYQRDRNDHLRLVTDQQYDPYFVPVHFFRSAQVLEEQHDY